MSFKTKSANVDKALFSCPSCGVNSGLKDTPIYINNEKSFYTGIQAKCFNCGNNIPLVLEVNLTASLLDDDGKTSEGLGNNKLFKSYRDYF